MTERLDSCCCGCSVRTGTLILGWLSTIGAFLSILSGIGLIVYALTLQKRNPYAVPLAIGIAAPVFILCGIGFAISITLLLGVYKKRPRLITPYIIYCRVGLVVCGIGMVLQLFAAYICGIGGIGVLYFATETVFLALGYYFFRIVKSYRSELREEIGEPFLEDEIYWARF